MTPGADAWLAAGARAAAAWASLALAACSGQGAPARDGAAGASASSGQTCQQIRLCEFDQPCADDACIATCAARGSPAAQVTFEALRACTAKACAATDPNFVNCACGEQCFGDGTCLAEVDACLAGATADMICDSLCN